MQIESQSVVTAVYYYVIGNLLGQIIIGLIFITIVYLLWKAWKWYIGDSHNYIEWIKKADRQKFSDDVYKWENEINKRVKALDKLKSVESEIRREIEKLHDIKKEKDSIDT